MTKRKTHNHSSSSRPQELAEKSIRDLVAKELRCLLLPKRIDGPNGAHVEIDGFCESARVLCEIYAHIGVLKGSQPSKILSDAARLQISEKWLGGNWKKVIAFADVQAAKNFQQQAKTWRAEVMKLFEIDIRVIDLPRRTICQIQKAQRKQHMANAPK